MKNLKTMFSRAAACLLAAAIVGLASAIPSRATVYQLPFDPTGGSLSETYISGTLANPQTLDFTLNLNAVYTSNPASSVSGDIQFGVFDNMGNMLFYGQTGGTAYSNNTGNITTVGSTQPWLNTMIFPALVSPGALPILMVSLVDSLGGLTTAAGATISPSLTVDLPAGLAVTPIPAALPLFASGLGMFGWMGWSRKRKPMRAIT
jgi:hypothetical protein